MQLKSRELGDLQIVTVEEDRIDAAVAIRFKDSVKEVTATGADLVILDLARVEFVDSSGLGAIVAAMKQLGATRRLDLASLQPAVDRVFRLTRMDSVFTIHENVEAAKAEHVE